MPPKKAKKGPLTDEEKYQHKLMMEQELQRLQRQYIVMERNRSIALSAQPQIRQQKVVNIFMAEHNNILTDLSVANAIEKKKEDLRLNQNLTLQLLQYNDQLDRTKISKTYINEIEGQIKAVKRRVMGLRAKQVTDRQHEDLTWKAFKTLEALENKLEVQVKKFCVICTKNRVLREEIDHLILERCTFIKMFDQFVKKMVQGKVFMLDLIEQATLAYDEREQWCLRLQALRTKARMDMAHNNQKMYELLNQKVNNTKIEEFLSLKNQKRLTHDLERKERRRRLEMKGKLEEKLARYSDLRNEIYHFCDDRMIDAIAHRYRLGEEANFSLFKYCNDMMLEMESVNDTLGDLHFQIDAKKTVHDARQDQQTLRLDGLERELRECTAEADACTRDNEDVDQYLNRVMAGIGQLFALLKCDKNPLLKLLGDNRHLRFYNVIFHCQMIEKRVHELLLMGHHKDRTMTEKKKVRMDKILNEHFGENPRIYTTNEIMDRTPCPACIEHEVVADVIETTQEVWSRNVARMKLQQRVKLPDFSARIHNVSACHLPVSREIIQRRYK